MSTPVNLAGRLTAEPELKFSSSGQPVARFTVVTSRRTKNDKSGEWGDKDTSFWDCIAFGHLAENIAESLTKGTPVLVSGRAAQRTWEAQDGSKRRSVEVVADDVAPSLRNASAKVSKARAAQSGQRREGRGVRRQLQRRAVLLRQQPERRPVDVIRRRLLRRASVLMDAGIAAAVVMYGGRVLLIRRAAAEGALLWQFPAGGMLPGEGAEGAAVREAAEETGLEVAVTGLRGERVHPGTGARVTYVTCTVASGTARAASPREVAEVRWVSAEEADELTGNTIYEPVRQYLREVAGGRPGPTGS